MPIYISMLRGINLAGHNQISMLQLRASLEQLGFERVKTYIQSGNVVFKAAKIAPDKLSKKIEDKIRSDFGFSISVLSKTPDELAKTIQNNPFLKQPGIDPSKLHVTFLSGAPADLALKKLAAIHAHPDQFHCLDCDVYLYCPEGYGRTKLSNNAIEKLLSLRATTRNWRTVNKLHEMAMEGD
jgi:uncharacterized protein (DUF1697 family)